jgi:hypothetical protein
MVVMLTQGKMDEMILVQVLLQVLAVTEVHLVELVGIPTAELV